WPEYHQRCGKRVGRRAVAGHDRHLEDVGHPHAGTRVDDVGVTLAADLHVLKGVPGRRDAGVTQEQFRGGFFLLTHRANPDRPARRAGWWAAHDDIAARGHQRLRDAVL